MKVTFHVDVLDEVERTARWYERERRGLGDEFLGELDDALARIEGGAPGARPVPEEPRAHRVYLARFPHAVVFVHAGAECFVVAVAHTKRRPGYWRSRVDDE